MLQFVSICQFACALLFQLCSVCRAFDAQIFVYLYKIFSLFILLKMQARLQSDCINECWLTKTCLGLKHPTTAFFEDSWMSSPSETLQADLLTRTLSPTEESQELAENSSMPVDPESAYRYPDIDT